MRRQDARKARLLELIREAGTAAELARRAGVNPAYISQIVTGTKLPSGKARNVGDEMAQKLERGMGKPVGWMDTTTGTLHAPLGSFALTASGTVGGAEGGELAHAPAPKPTLPDLLARLRPKLESLPPEVRELIGQMLLAYARDPSQSEKLAEAINVWVPEDP